MEKTAWFPAGVKPVRKGMYECGCGCGWKIYWNGKFWEDSVGDRDTAMDYHRWRGLKQPAK